MDDDSLMELFETLHIKDKIRFKNSNKKLRNRLHDIYKSYGKDLDEIIKNEKDEYLPVKNIFYNVFKTRFPIEELIILVDNIGYIRYNPNFYRLFNRFILSHERDPELLIRALPLLDKLIHAYDKPK